MYISMLVTKFTLFCLFMLGLVVWGKSYLDVTSYPQWSHLYILFHIYIVTMFPMVFPYVSLWCINMRNIFHKCLFSTCLDTVCIQLCAGHCCAGRTDYIPIPMVTCFLFLCLVRWVKFEVLLLQLLQVNFEQVFLTCFIAS